VETDTVDLSTPTVDAPPVADATPTPEETSVNSHRASFGTPAQREHAAKVAAQAPVPEPAVNQPQRHRAQSQKATPADVPRIAELTKKWREEQETRTRLEKELNELRAAAKAPVSAPEPSAKTTLPATSIKEDTGNAFPEREPSIEDFRDKDDPYSAWVRATAAWDRRRETWEAKQAEAAETAAKQAAASQQTYHTELTTHQSRVAEYIKTKPDLLPKLQEMSSRDIPELLFKAIIGLDNSPQVLDILVSDPVFLDDMHLLADGKSVTDANVALMRRRLSAQVSRSQAGTTGSAATMPAASQAPRPPNPVRTGPMKQGDEPPGEGHSVADHRKHYDPRRR